VPDLLTNGALFFLLVYALAFNRTALGDDGSILYRLMFFGEPINITLLVDGFSLFMLFTISVVSFAVTLFSIDYIEHYGAKANFYALLLIMIAGMNGLVLTQDLFTTYVFLEVAAVASYALVAYGLGHDELEASFKYLMLSAVASGFIVVSIALIFNFTGSLEFSSVANALKTLNEKYVLGVCTALFIMGFGLKAALVPFHAWLPDAHPSAPAPISAMLSGLLIKVSGIYALTRIFLNIFGITPTLSTLLLYLGLVSVVAGALLALGQNDIKRMLAYSSISQVGYILLGIGLGTPLGIMGGLFHLLNHALAKGLLFLNSGSIEMSTHTRALDKMGGLAKRMPITAGTSVVGSLAITGVPPLNGFWSKLIIIIALIQAKAYVVAMIAVLASVITLWYYLIIQRRAFFGTLNEAWSKVNEAPFWMRTSMLFLAALCIVIGIFFTFFIAFWIAPAASALQNAVSGGLHVLGL